MDIAAGRRKLSELKSRLQEGREIQEPYAEALAAQARRIATSRPTPQARMVGEAIRPEGESILVPSSAMLRPRIGPSVLAGNVAGGAEFGSSIYPQFGPRRGSPGAFMGAAAARPDSATIGAGEEALEELVRESVR